METLTQPNPLKNVKNVMSNGSHTSTGLKTTYAKDMSTALNGLLASMQTFYTNVRGYHWNVRGSMFFTMHAKYEELYTDLATKSDEIAERVLSLDHTPIHTLTGYLDKTEIPESTKITDPIKIATEICSSLNVLIRMEREMVEKAEENGDTSTADMLTSYARDHEKLMWMYRAQSS